MDAKNMWLAMAAFALVLLGWKALNPPASIEGEEPHAVVSVGYGADQTLEKITRAQCSGDRLWVSHPDGNDCITVIASPSLGSGLAETAVLFVDGDVPTAEMNQAGDERMRATYRRVTDEFSTKFGVPLLVVSRPGVLGSSGMHQAGGRREDVHAIDSAVDELKRKYSIRRVVMAGQSGGARMIAQLLVMGRADIECAVLGSGAYDVPRLVTGGRTSTDIFGDPGRRFIVPMLRVKDIAAAPGRRLFLVGDRRDQVTPFDEQQAFAEKLNQLGHHAVLVEAEAKDERFHGLSRTSLEAAGQCAKGVGDAEIVAATGRRVTIGQR